MDLCYFIILRDGNLVVYNTETQQFHDMKMRVRKIKKDESGFYILTKDNVLYKYKDYRKKPVKMMENVCDVCSDVDFILYY